MFNTSGSVGNIILRDRNADHYATFGYGQSGAGLEERIYAIHGPDGNVTGITDATGEILERFVYDPTGNFQVLTPLGLKTSIDTNLGTGDDGLANYFDRPEHNFVGLSDDNLGGTEYAWRFFQHGQYFDRIVGLYRNNSGTARNPRTDQTLVPNTLAYMGAKNAYQVDDGPGFWNGALAGASLAGGLIALGIALPPLGAFMLLAGAFYAGYDYGSRLNAGEDQWHAIAGTALDVTGINGIYTGWTGRDLMTQRNLHLSQFERGAMFGGGVVQLSALAFAAYKFVQSRFGTPEVNTVAPPPSQEAALPVAERAGTGVAINRSGIPNPMIEVTRMTPAELVKIARSAFNSTRVDAVRRANFLREFSTTPEAQLRFDESQIVTMRAGRVPEGWEVHHMKPLFRGGDSSYDNLIMVPERWHADNYFDLHFYPEGYNPFGKN